MSDIIVCALEIIKKGESISKDSLIKEVENRVNCEVFISHDSSIGDYFYFDCFAHGVDFHVMCNFIPLFSDRKSEYLDCIAQDIINGLGRRLFTKKEGFNNG